MNVDPQSLSWPLADHLDVRDRLLAAYADGRGYHDTRHLAEVLARLEELGSAADPVVVLAAWFHDAVYDGRPEAEERSAVLAESLLADAHLDVAEVARLVRLTATHDPAPGDACGAALCDADLAILAADRARYDEYAADVRREHATLPDDAFRAGRLAVLQALAGREHLFHTDHGRRAWEDAARTNLAREIAALGG